MVWIRGKRMNEKFDIFISYNSIDQALVTALAARLNQQKLNVFLDRWQLIRHPS